MNARRRIGTRIAVRALMSSTSIERGIDREASPGVIAALVGRVTGTRMTGFGAARQKWTPWVLVVDDEPLAARATSRAITAATGARVSVVSGVDAALHLVRRADEAPAAVVLDFDLKAGETGMAVLLGLRAAGCEAPCAFHTGSPARARAALAAARLGDRHPVFEKGPASSAGFPAWLSNVLGAASAHSSGVRPKLV